MLFGHFWARNNYVCATVVSPLNSKNNFYVYSVSKFLVVQNLNMISAKSTLFMSRLEAFWKGLLGNDVCLT